MLNDRDRRTLINKANQKLADIYGCRVRVENATPAIVSFYRQNAAQINATVVILESKDDDSNAAAIRNSGKSAIFVFSESYDPLYGVSSYFSGTTNLLEFPKALIKRSLQK